ncbi:MAG: efflux RND transporter periplasmic adaptor subunit [Desulfovibrionaceae bacterium]|nr:efflux RND transporter periplasmic adaptor subunit [Desulfovibrionaceae bacterium]
MTTQSARGIFQLPLCLALAIAASACSDDRKAADSSAQMPPPLVATMEIAPENVPVQATYMGQTAGYLSATVSAQVGGILKQRTYREGDYVTKGQVLFEIDPASYQAALDQAQGQLTMAQTQYNNAKREYDRILPLYSRNAVSQRDRDNAQAAYDSARAQVETARAAVDQARIQLGYTKVAAPISGYTSSESVTEGNLIAPGTPLTTINQTDPMYVNFSIPSSEMRMTKRLVAERRATATMDEAYAIMQLLEGEQLFIGKVSFVDTKVDPGTSAVHARAWFPNPEGGLMPGQYAAVTISGLTLTDAMMVPQNAVLQTAQGTMVYVVDKENKAQLTPIRLGQIFGNEFMLNGGLEPGATIVVEGINKVRPGSPITPRPLPHPSRETPLSAPASISKPEAGQPDAPSPALPADEKAAAAAAGQSAPAAPATSGAAR